MLSSVGLTLSGLIFTFLIAIIYFSKKKYAQIENKLYAFLLIWTIFLLLLELYCVFTMKIRNVHPVLNELLCRLYVFGAVVWIVSVFIYAIILGKQEKYNSFRDLIKEPLVCFFMLLGIGVFIYSCFQPLTYTSGIHNELYVIGGGGITVLYVISSFVGIYLIGKLFINKNKLSFFQRLPIIFFFIFYILMLIFQFLYTDINDLTFMFGLTVVAMYFTIVSQDYKLVADLEVASKEAEEANKEKTEFLSKMSHEIRTPMNTIMGFSEALMNDDDVTQEKLEADVKNIYIASNNLISTINNVLDVSRIESGKEVLDERKYYIGDIIFELQSFVEARIDKEKVIFNIDFDENIPRLLLGDKHKIYKVLLNLLNNSTRYTTSGEIKLKVEAKCDRGYANLKFTVSDTGIGIKEEDFDKIFLKFAKLETDLKDLERGAGLGLNIAKSLADIMHGKLSFTSEYNVGSTFVFELSNRIMDYHKCGNILSEKQAADVIASQLDCSGKRIMVVDDNKLNLRVADKLLRTYNFDVTLVESGLSCIELLKKKQHFDLILLDHMMPDLNGIETIRIIKKMDDYKSLPIIVMTANAVSEVKELYIKEGFSGYLSKPIDSKKLNGLIEYYFKK